MKVKSESEVTQLCPMLATPGTAAHQAPPPMGFSRQDYWSGGAIAFSIINASCYYYFHHLNVLLLKAEKFSKAAFNQPFLLVDIGFLPLKVFCLRVGVIFVKLFEMQSLFRD